MKKLSQAESARFVEVKVAASEMEAVTSGSRMIEVRLRNGHSLLAGPGFDAHHVRALLAVVEIEA